MFHHPTQIRVSNFWFTDHFGFRHQSVFLKTVAASEKLQIRVSVPLQISRLLLPVSSSNVVGGEVAWCDSPTAIILPERVVKFRRNFRWGNSTFSNHIQFLIAEYSVVHICGAPQVARDPRMNDKNSNAFTRALSRLNYQKDNRSCFLILTSWHAPSDCPFANSSLRVSINLGQKQKFASCKNCLMMYIHCSDEQNM